MVSKITAGRDEREKRLSEAYLLFLAQASNLAGLKAKLSRSRTTYLVAGYPADLPGIILGRPYPPISASSG